MSQDKKNEQKEPDQEKNLSEGLTFNFEKVLQRLEEEPEKGELSPEELAAMQGLEELNPEDLGMTPDEVAAMMAFDAEIRELGEGEQQEDTPLEWDKMTEEQRAAFLEGGDDLDEALSKEQKSPKPEAGGDDDFWDELSRKGSYWEDIHSEDGGDYYEEYDGEEGPSW